MPVRFGAPGHVFSCGGKWAEDPSRDIGSSKGRVWDPVREADGSAKRVDRAASKKDIVCRKPMSLPLREAGPNGNPLPESITRLPHDDMEPLYDREAPLK